MSFFEITGVFFSKRQDGSALNSFQDLGRKHLYITICIEKQCTQPLKTEMGTLKSRVQCFSMQVVMNKRLHLNPEKNLSQIHPVVLEKNANFNSEQ